MSNMLTWLITGASQGLGLEIVCQLASAPNNLVIAAVQNPESASQLHTVQRAEGLELQAIQLDVSDESSIRMSVDKVKDILNDRGLDYLYNNAGISAEGDAFNFSYERFLTVLQANVAAPALLASLYLPLLKRGVQKTIVNVSSGSGSHNLLKDGESGMVAYYMSKTAVNMLTQKQAWARPDIVTVSLTPGWVQTDMGGAEAPLTPQESVTGQLEAVRRLRKEDSGKFFSYNGTELPW